MKYDDTEDYSISYIKGHCYSNNNKDVDFNSLELLFLYVQDYKLFQNKEINLNPRYIFDYSPCSKSLNINKNKNFIDLFGKNINLKVFCGENGTGKTTILEFIKNMDMISPSKGFIVLKDKNNKFITTKRSLNISFNNKEYCCNSVMDSNFTIKSLINDNQERWNPDLYCTKRNIYENYAQYPDLYNKYSKQPLFNGFELRFFNFEKNIEKILHKFLDSIKLAINEIEPSELYRYFRLYPLQYIVLSQAEIEFFDRYSQRIEDDTLTEGISAVDVENSLQQAFLNYSSEIGLKEKTINNLNDELIGYIYNHLNIVQSENSLHKEISEDSFFKGYDTKKYDYQDLLEDVNDCLLFIFQSIIPQGDCFKMNMVFDRDVHKHINLLYFKPYNLVGEKRVYPEDLSVGEYARLKMITDLITLLNDKSEETSILLNDEIDAHMHPGWAKDYLYEYIGTINNDKHPKPKIMHKKLNIIMTTHSPFILSDVTNDYVEYLEKQGNCGYIREKHPIQNTFAGNILQMFADNFFLDSTMGKYSKTILQEIVTFLSNGELYLQPLFLKPYFSRDKKLKLCKMVIDSVGDEILKKMLQEKYERFIKNEKN